MLICGLQPRVVQVCHEFFRKSVALSHSDSGFGAVGSICSDAKFKCRVFMARSRVRSEIVVVNKNIFVARPGMKSDLYWKEQPRENQSRKRLK